MRNAACTLDEALNLVSARARGVSGSAGVAIKQPSPTIRELLQKNLTDLRKKTREAGWESNRYHTEMFTRLWGERNCMDLTRREVEHWASERRGQRAHATVQHELALLQRAYNLALDEGWIPENPLARVKVKLRPVRRHQVLTPDQQQRLQTAYVKIFPLGELLWLVEKFALLTGCRIGEQAHLRVEHVRGDVLEIPEEGKTGSRLVPLCRPARAIAELFKEMAEDQGSPWLFWSDKANPNRTHVGNNHVSKVWRRACRAAGIVGVQRRDLRRTFASQLIAKGVPIFEVQKLLGHTSPTRTMIYCQVGFDRLQQSVSVLDSL